ncbi:AbrB/MazE/SpoVT family DNA-binding domain-containing protein [Natranaerobius trueperi]|uniref:AbrB family transcriptional regulator n=1 Tax=Natranaerobius trueperi TaxID=759412 RepID=A0A226BZ99_9FIRM|nr:AbrB/MazE/SpoVT family DNA-binding domain-containing protein [Natranaerobius trueperi]OWZ83644.1 AbrB family transcriptional regulator [Natranaerobius trueperi]
MKSTGLVRKVDELGRIVIPIELRRNLGIEQRDSLEIYIEGENIILKKYEPACIFCGTAQDGEMIHHKGKNICRTCAKELSNS